jgi:hypothetical protein
MAITRSSAERPPHTPGGMPEAPKPHPPTGGPEGRLRRVGNGSGPGFDTDLPYRPVSPADVPSLPSAHGPGRG